MSLVDELMKADARKADEMVEGVFKSRQLAKILGKDEPVDVKIREISPRRKNELVATAYDGDEVDFSKAFDANLKVIIAGVIDPPLKDKDLQEKFGCKMAIDLAEKLFKDEVNSLSTAIVSLGTIGDEVLDEDEIKN
jgi:hypothetical protein